MNNKSNLNENSKRDNIIKGMTKNKRELVRRYGNKAEEVMYKRADKLAEQHNIMETNKLRELVRKSLMSEVEFSKEYDNNPALKGGQKKLPDALQKAIIKKGNNEVDEALGTKIKAGAEYVKTGLQNLKKAWKGEGNYESPKLAAQKTKLQTKIGRAHV